MGDELGQVVPDAGDPEERIPVAESLDAMGDSVTDESLMSAADGVAAIRESVGIPANAGSGGSRVSLPDESVSAGLHAGEPVDDEPVAEPVTALEPMEPLVVSEPVTAPAVELLGDTVMIYADAEQRTRQDWPNTYGYDPELWP